jgi:hypothetical protein
MGCLEVSGVPVLYIGRTVPKGKTPYNLQIMLATGKMYNYRRQDTNPKYKQVSSHSTISLHKMLQYTPDTSHF